MEQTDPLVAASDPIAAHLAINEPSEGEEEDALDTLSGERRARVWDRRRRRSDRSPGRPVFRLQENDDPPPAVVGQAAGAHRTAHFLLRGAELCQAFHRGGAKTRSRAEFAHGPRYRLSRQQ